MQKTDFPFEAIVHDDASTDHSADIIREYAEKYPNIIKPIFETENQYFKGKEKSMTQKKMDRLSKGKYIAICEGDDFWTDPLKLQKQISFLEAHPSYSMSCCRTKLYSERRHEYIGEVRPTHKSSNLSAVNIILKGGLFIATASIVYRRSVRDNYPLYCRNCHVGDYPLQIMCAMKGSVYYIDNPMAVYRVENSNSWVGRTQKSEQTLQRYEQRMKGVRSELEMLQGFSNDYSKYKKPFYERICFFMNVQLHEGLKEEYYNIYEHELKSFIAQRNMLWKIDAFMRNTPPPME